MTAKQLIVELQKCPPDSEVIVAKRPQGTSYNDLYPYQVTGVNLMPIYVNRSGPTPSVNWDRGYIQWRETGVIISA